MGRYNSGAIEACLKTPVLSDWQPVWCFAQAALVFADLASD